jgi:hypothetical protein
MYNNILSLIHTTVNIMNEFLELNNESKVVGTERGKVSIWWMVFVQCELWIFVAIPRMKFLQFAKCKFQLLRHPISRFLWTLRWFRLHIDPLGTNKDCHCRFHTTLLQAGYKNMGQNDIPADDDDDCFSHMQERVIWYFLPYIGINY